MTSSPLTTAGLVPMLDITGRPVWDADAFDLGVITRVIGEDADELASCAIVLDRWSDCCHLVPLQGLRGGPTGALHTPYPERDLRRVPTGWQGRYLAG
jgi:hypothetical protein